MENNLDTDYKSPYKTITEFKKSNVIVGGKVTIKADTAIDLLNLTTAIPFDADTKATDIEQRRIEQGEFCRSILRAMAKNILYPKNAARIDPTAILQQFL